MDDNTFFMIMMTFGGLMGLLTLVYVIRRLFSRQSGEVGGWELRGAWRRIGAVVRTTLAEGLRAKVASGFALLILVAIPIFWATADGDGTIKGKVQMFFTYSLGFTNFLLAILTILFSCRSLSTEIASRQIYGVVTKPIPRWQIVVGKWLGVMILNVVLLSLAMLMTWAGTKLTMSTFKSRLERDLVTHANLTPAQATMAVSSLSDVRGIGRKGLESPVVAAMGEQLGKTRDEIGEILLKLPEEMRFNLRRFDELRRQVLVARTHVAVEVPDLSKEVEEVFQQLKKDDRLPAGWTEERVREAIKKELTIGYCSIGYGEGRTWEIKGPAPDEGRDWVMSLRFKIRAPRQPIAAKVGDLTLEADQLLCEWGLGNPKNSNFLQAPPGQYPINAANEFEIPQQGVDKDGTILLSFLNIDPRGIEAIFDLPAGALSVMYRVGPWELGLFQAMLASLVPLCCLAAFGVCASTFLTFPVGSLIVLTLYIISSSMGFVADSLAVAEEYAPQEHERELAWEVRRLTVDALGFALSIGDLDPVNLLMEGRAVGWAALGSAAWKFVLLKGTLVLILAVMIFRRRELAAVVV